MTYLFRYGDIEFGIHFEKWPSPCYAQYFKTSFAGGYTEKQNTRGIDKDSKKTSTKNSLESRTEFGYKCVCLNARSIVNKRNELNIMVEDIDPHIIGITESWATPDISYAEL